MNGDLRKSHEGCGIFFEAKGENSTHFDGLLIEACRLERTDRNGICQRSAGKVRSKNVMIRGNTLEDIGGGAKRTLVYNNTIIIGSEHNVPMLLFTDWDGGKAKDVSSDRPPACGAIEPASVFRTPSR